MHNEYKTYNCQILKIAKEGSDSKNFTLSLPYKKFKFTAGQYVMVSLPGFGEAPISISSNISEKRFFQLTVRKAGVLTAQMHKKKKGEIIGIRGPYGRGFPVELAKIRNVLIVAGGIGIEPVRPFILDVVNNPNNFKKSQLFYGAKRQDDLMFKKEYNKWKKIIDFNVTVDCSPKLVGLKTCSIGVVTTLFDKVKVLKDSVVFLCGPPVMYRFVLEKLKEYKFKDEDIYLSLERHMDCGQGVCQHCAVGPYYVCKDGPVFSYEELKNFKTWLEPI